MNDEIETDPVEMILHLIDTRAADDDTGACKDQLRDALTKFVDERIAADRHTRSLMPERQ